MAGTADTTLDSIFQLDVSLSLKFEGKCALPGASPKVFAPFSRQLYQVRTAAFG